MASSCSSKDPEPCAICLEPLNEEAYLDTCFHSFCYPCILYWSNVLSRKSETASSSIKCPLCKTDNYSIIHNFDGEHFQRHYINQIHAQSFLSGAHKFRLQWYYNNNVRVLNNESDVQLYWKRCRYIRRNVWLENWLRREIQALTQEEDVEIIAHHVKGVIESFVRREQRDGVKNVVPEMKRREFRGLVFDSAHSFLLGRTERFVDELEAFLVLGLNIEAYDEVCMQSLAGVSASTE